MDIMILNRDETLKKISDEEFIFNWKQLAKKVKKYTLIQEYDFVARWYQSYINKYDPLLVVGYDTHKKIIALLPLAIDLDNGDITHAGGVQAEYKGWICLSRYEDDFLIKSLILIKEKFNLDKWDWGWMPPDADTAWLYSKQLKVNHIYVNMTTCQSPVYDLTDRRRLAELKKSKSTKSKINRLKRTGDLRIERIFDSVKAKKIFSDVMKKYSFRCFAAYNFMPFEADKNKESWHLCQLDELTNHHFTVLWHGDDVLACNLGPCTKDTVIIGLFAYNPVQGAHSPGKIFLYMLIEYMTKEGYRYLDLSPGGDAYKEHFSNLHHTLTKPVFCFSKTYQMIDYTLSFCANKVKKQCSRKDINHLISTYQTYINNFFTRKSVLGYKKNQLIQMSDTDLGEINKLNIRFQKYDDLLLYKQVNGYATRKEVILSGLKNFERGDVLYTLVQNEELILYSWVSTSDKKHHHSDINRLTNIVGKHVLIYDLYFIENSIEKRTLVSFLQNIVEHYRYDLYSDVYIMKPILTNKAYFMAPEFNSITIEKISEQEQ